jgi:hypothetical protein
MYLYLANCSAAETVQTFSSTMKTGTKNGHSYKFRELWLAAFVRVAGKAGEVFMLVPPRACTFDCFAMCGILNCFVHFVCAFVSTCSGIYI